MGMRNKFSSSVFLQNKHSYSMQSEKKKILKHRQQNNPKIDNPKNTVRGQQRVDCLCLSPSKESTSDTEQSCGKGPNQNAQLTFFCKNTCYAKMQEKFFYFFSLSAIVRAAAEIFCNREYKRRWFIWQSSCGSHDKCLRTLALACTYQLLPHVILCAAAHPASLFPCVRTLS